MKLSSVSLVIAAYNEADTLRQVFEQSLATLRRCAEEYEVIILDDASTDGTGAIADQLCNQHPDCVRVIRHAVNRGIAVTFEELCQAATKDYVFDVPADGEYPPEALERIVSMESDYDIVVCNRVYKNYSTYRRILSFLYRWLPKVLFGVELHDPGSTKFRRQTLIREIPVTSTGVFREAERLIRAARRGYRIGKIDIEPQRRAGGDPQGARFDYVTSAALDLFCLWIRLSILRQRP